MKVLVECVEMMELDAKSKLIRINTEFKFDGSHCFTFDKERLQQVLISLLSNAIKFSENNSEVHLNVNIEKTNFIRGTV